MEQKKRIVVIANPFSGNKIGKDIDQALKTYLDSEIYDYEIQYTEYPSHAIEIARHAADHGYYAVIAAGGDGTLNEVVNGVSGKPIIIGIIPAGSGNGFAHHLGIRHNIEKAISVINKGNTMQIDIGKLNDRYFINLGGVGLDAKVAYKTQKNKSRGFLPYFLQTLSEIVNFKSSFMVIETPEKTWSGAYVTAVIANGSIYGYDFTIAPASILHDGQFDVLLFKKAPLWKYLINLPKLLRKKIHTSELVEYFKTSKITITPRDKVFYHVDGEGFETDCSIEFSIMPNHITIFTPA